MLFTISTFSAVCNLEESVDNVNYNHHKERENYVYSEEYQKKYGTKGRTRKESSSEESSTKRSGRGPTKQAEAVELEDEGIEPESDLSKSKVRESDLLGLEDPSSKTKEGTVYLTFDRNSFI